MRPRRVSVVMAVLNGERFIDEAIQSIVDQTYTDCELVVIDDGSNDGTADHVHAFKDKLPIRYVRHSSTTGIPRSMNDGVRHAVGEFIAFLDHDDAWCPEFLETQVRYLDEHPQVGMVHCDFQTIGTGGGVIEPSVAACRGRRRPSGRVFRQLFMDSFIVGNSVLIRRECFTRLGLFDEALRWGDYHMWLRIARHYEVDYVDRVLTKYRQHPTQSTRSIEKRRPDERPVALAALENILAAYPEVREELGERAIGRRFAGFYFDLAYGCFTAGDPAGARAYARRALVLWPASTQSVALYAASLLRPGQARAARAAWRWLRREPPPLAGRIRGITG